MNALLVIPKLKHRVVEQLPEVLQLGGRGAGVPTQAVFKDLLFLETKGIKTAGL